MSDAGSPGRASPAAHGDPQPSIAEVQARILEQLQAARAVLTAHSGSGSLPKDELAEVLEELSHSTALLATVKRDLDGMFSRLRRTRAALAAAFPQHAVAPRQVAPHEEEENAAPGRRQQHRLQQGQQRQDGQQDLPAAAGEDGQPGKRQQGQQQQGQQQQAVAPSLEQDGDAMSGAAVAGAAAAGGAQHSELQEDAVGQEHSPDVQAEKHVEAAGRMATARAAAEAPPDASPGS